MYRLLSIILMAFSCAITFAQENCPIMTVHQQGGRTFHFAVEKVDSITFTTNKDTLILHYAEGNLWRFAAEKVDSISFGTEEKTNIHESIDLGLSVLWAMTNVGSTAPEGLGGRFAWGETEEKRSFYETNYRFYENEQYTYIGVNICGTKYDVARLRWGDTWRMPTRSEIRELTTRCKWTAETRNSIAGYRVTGPNGNHIFLPAAGYQNGSAPSEVGEGGFYWSGSLDRSMPSAAYNLNFRGYDAEWTANRSYGFSIRPVR